MRRLALFLLTLSLLAFGCEMGALCSAAQATDSSCCCPLMEAMGMDGMGMGEGRDATPPCMDESDEMPMPGDSEATFDGVAQAWNLSPAPSLVLPHAAAQELGPQVAGDLASGHGPALYLLGCSFLN